jgi:hypothetical protein
MGNKGITITNNTSEKVYLVSNRRKESTSFAIFPDKKFTGIHYGNKPFIRTMRGVEIELFDTFDTETVNVDGLHCEIEHTIDKTGFWENISTVVTITQL